MDTIHAIRVEEVRDRVEDKHFYVVYIAVSYTHLRAHET